jgi:hypothetical protein
MKKIFYVIFLMIIGMDISAKRPRFSTTREKKEEWIVGVGACGCCCGYVLGAIPGVVVHTPYKIGVEGSVPILLGGTTGESFTIFGNIQLIYDIVKKRKIFVSKYLSNYHLYTGIGVAGYHDDTKWYVGGKFELNKQTDVGGITISLGTDIEIKLPNISGCGLSLHNRKLIIGAKILLLSPWYDRRYNETLLPSDKIDRIEKTRNLLFKAVYFFPLPYILLREEGKDKITW